MLKLLTDFILQENNLIAGWSRWMLTGLISLLRRFDPDSCNQFMYEIVNQSNKEQTGVFLNQDDVETILKTHFESLGHTVNNIDIDYEYALYDEDRYLNGFTVGFLINDCQSKRKFLKRYKPYCCKTCIAKWEEKFG